MNAFNVRPDHVLAVRDIVQKQQSAIATLPVDPVVSLMARVSNFLVPGHAGRKYLEGLVVTAARLPGDQHVMIHLYA